MTLAKSFAVGGDHAGFDYKDQLIDFLTAQGFTVKDCGTYSADSVDYPDFAHAVCDRVAGSDGFGILVCGTGIGMAIAANRHPGIRAAVLHNATEARLTRAHNNANIACLGARTTGIEVALDAIRAFLASPFEGGRHVGRVQKLDPALAKQGAAGAKTTS